MCQISCRFRCVLICYTDFHRRTPHCSNLNILADEMPTSITLCAVCQKEAEKKCSRCKTISYCSKVCQGSNWKQHKVICQVNEPVPPDLSSYTCVPIEGKGEGLRSIRDIKYGEVIILEKPVMDIGKVVLKKVNPFKKLEKFPESMRESMKIQLERGLKELNDTSEIILGDEFKKLSIETQKRVMKLYDCHQKQDTKSLLGIVSTNGLIQQNGNTLVFLTISKLNNSCLPNVAFEFVPPYGRIFAIKDIKKEEELCIDYGGYGSRFSNLNDRREMLKDKYDFDCACDLCTMDANKYIEIEKSRLRYKTIEEQIPKTTDPQKMGCLIKERFEMMEKGQLMHPGLVALHANDSFQLANGLGNYDEAKRYAKMAHDALSIKYGKDNPRSILYKNYLENKITGNMLIQQLSSIKISI